MLRGFRWQLLALLLAILLFSAAALFRLGREASVIPSPSLTPSPATASATIEPSPTSPVLEQDPQNDASQESNANGRSAFAYREGLVGSLQRLNPLFAHLNPVDNDISNLLFEGLFAINAYGEVEPRLAAELVVAGDGLEYVVRLREDIRWQDGIPFSAADVAFTISLLSEAGYAEVSPAGAFWQTVETQVLGDLLLRFRLAQPLGSFPYHLTFGILPVHALRGVGIAQLAAHPFNLSPIGTGPFQLASLRASVDGRISAADLALSPVYQERPDAQAGFAYRHLTFKLYGDADAAIQAYESGEIDALANIAPRQRLLAMPNSQVYTQVESVLNLLIFNWNDDLFSERRVRQALSLSLDVPQLVAAHLGSDATYADSPYLSSFHAYQPNPFWKRYDFPQALYLLEAAEVFATDEEATEDSGDESAAEPVAESGFSLLVEDSNELRILANAVATQWRRLGFQIEVEFLPAEQQLERLQSGNFAAAIVAHRLSGDPDLYHLWHPSQHPDGGNFGAVAQNELAELLESGRGEIYTARRAEVYSEFQHVFAEEAIAIPLSYPLYTFVVRDVIDGIQLGFLETSADRFRNIAEWHPVNLAS